MLIIPRVIVDPVFAVVLDPDMHIKLNSMQHFPGYEGGATGDDARPDSVATSTAASNASTPASTPIGSPPGNNDNHCLNDFLQLLQ